MEDAWNNTEASVEQTVTHQMNHLQNARVQIVKVSAFGLWKQVKTFGKQILLRDLDGRVNENKDSYEIYGKQNPRITDKE